MTEQTITGGGVNTAAAVAGMMAPIAVTAGSPVAMGKAATGLARVPGLGGSGLGAHMVRSGLASTATAEAGMVGAGNFDGEAIQYINEMDVGELAKLAGIDAGETGIPLGALAPVLGLLGPAVGPAARSIASKGQRLTDRYTNPARSAAHHVLDAVYAGGQGIDDIRQMRNRAGGSLRALDVNEQTRRPGGSANRLGRSQELQGFATERRDARPQRMQDTFAEAVDAPQTVRDDPIEGTRAYGVDLEEHRQTKPREMGYGHGGGTSLRLSDQVIPEERLDPTRTDYAEGHTYRDEARLLDRQGRDLGLTGDARRIEIGNDGAEASGALRAVPDDARLARFSVDQMKELLGNRGLPTDTLYKNDDPAQGVVKRGLGQGDLRQRLRRLRAEDEARGGPPPENDAPVAVDRLRSLKSAANDAAEAAKRSGHNQTGRAMTRFAERLRVVLADGVRGFGKDGPGTGRRVSMIGDEYFKVISRAVEMLETGRSLFRAKPEDLAQAVDDLQAARARLAGDTRLRPKVRRNLLTEFDRSFEAYRVGAVRSYLDFIESSPVGRDARIFNTERQAMVARLRTLFDSEEDLQAFLRSVDDEYLGQQGERAVLPRSDTPERIAQDQALRESTGGTADGRGPDILNTLRGGINAVVFDFIGARMRNASDRVVRGVTTRVADEIARILSSGDLEAVARELEAVRASGRAPTIADLPPNVRRVITRAVRQGRHNGEPAGGQPSVHPSRAQPGDPVPKERGAMPRPTADPDARRGPATMAPDRAERIRQLVNDPDGDVGPRFELVGELDDKITAIRQTIDDAMTQVANAPTRERAASALRTIKDARKAIRREQLLTQARARKSRTTVSSHSQDARSRAISNTIEEQTKAIDAIENLLKRLIKNPDFSDEFSSELYRLNPHSGYGGRSGRPTPSFGTTAKPGMTFGEIDQTAKFLGGKEAADLMELAEDLAQTLGDDLARATDRGATLHADGRFRAYLSRAIADPADAAEEVAHIASLAKLFSAEERRALISVAKAWRKKQPRDPLAGYDDVSRADFEEELIAKYLARSEQRFSSGTTLGNAIDRFFGLLDLIQTAFSKDMKAKILAGKFQRGELAQKISDAIAESRKSAAGGSAGRAPLVLATRQLRRAAAEPR